jgi:hypothetical protein
LNGIQEVRGSNPLSSTSLHQAGWYRGGKPFVPERRRVFVIQGRQSRLSISN